MSSGVIRVWGGKCGWELATNSAGSKLGDVGVRWECVEKARCGQAVANVEKKEVSSKISSRNGMKLLGTFILYYNYHLLPLAVSSCHQVQRKIMLLIVSLQDSLINTWA